MAVLTRSLLVFLLGAAASVALSSCGGGGDSGLLPGSTASEINSNLDKVPQLVAEGDCAGAEAASAEISVQIEQLGGVDSRLKEALSEGAARLADVVSTCQEVPTEEDEEIEAREVEENLKAEEAEEDKEKKEKSDKPKPEKDKEPKGPAVEPPGQEKKEEEVITPEEETGGTPSGGVGPGAAVEGE